MVTLTLLTDTIEYFDVTEPKYFYVCFWLQKPSNKALLKTMQFNVTKTEEGILGFRIGVSYFLVQTMITLFRVLKQDTCIKAKPRELVHDIAQRMELSSGLVELILKSKGMINTKPDKEPGNGTINDKWGRSS